MPYINRLPQLTRTLVKMWGLWEFRKDWEIVLVADSKCTPGDISGLLDLVDGFANRGGRCKVIIDTTKDRFGPTHLFNKAADKARGQYLIITNPECAPENDILAGFDVEFAVDPNCYVVCACKSVGQDWGFIKWFNHSTYKPKDFHWCSTLSRANYLSIGGFDEEFGQGWAYDDNDFRDAVRAFGLSFRRRDDLVTLHQYHAKCQPPNHRALLDLNRKRYCEKWGVSYADALKQESL